MKVFTYSRVSTVDQNLDAQRNELARVYPESVAYEEKVSATSLKNRTQLQAILKAIGTGDKLVVWKLDRLARNMKDLSEIVSSLEERGAALEILDQRIDTSTASGKAFLQMLGVFAEFENNIRKERQAIGIAKAKTEGKYKGKQVNTEKHAQVREYLDKGYPVQEIVKLTGMGKSSIYLIKKRISEENDRF